MQLFNFYLSSTLIALLACYIDIRLTAKGDKYPGIIPFLCMIPTINVITLGFLALSIREKAIAKENRGKTSGPGD